MRATLLTLIAAAAPALACARQPAPIIVPHLASAPMIDGAVGEDEWRGALEVRLDGMTPSENPGWNPFNSTSFEPGDLSCVLRVAHDGTALLIAFDITDDSISSTHVPRENAANASVWEDDCTEVFIDGDFDRDEPSEGSADARRSKDAEWGEGMIPHYAIPHGTYWDNGRRLYGQRLNGWFARSKVVSPTRWQAEYRIPLSAIDTLDGPGARPLAPGMTFGLNALVNDADRGEPRRHQLAWNGSTHDNRLYLQQHAWLPAVLATPSPAPVD